MHDGYDLLLAGGPCAGEYSTRYAPLNLLAVRGPGGERDVLDAPDDAPELLEELHRYIEYQPRTSIRICGRGAAAGCWVTVTYRYAGAVDRETGELTPHDDQASVLAAEVWLLEHRRRVFERAFPEAGCDSAAPDEGDDQAAEAPLRPLAELKRELQAPPTLF